MQSGGALVHGQQFAPGVTVPWTLAGSGDGPRTIYGQWQDALGRWSPVASAAVTVDRTAPQVAAPFPALLVGSRLAGSGIQVGVTTQVTDTGSGVAKTTTESAHNGGSWTQLGQGLTPAPSVQVDTTGTWQLRATAIDNAGNASAATTGRSFKALVTEDSSKSVVYSGKWTKSNNSSASSGSTHYATAKGASATMAFSGSSVAWIAPTSVKYGKAKVFIDGVLVSTVDLGSPRRPSWWSLPGRGPPRASTRSRSRSWARRAVPASISTRSSSSPDRGPALRSARCSGWGRLLRNPSSSPRDETRRADHWRVRLRAPHRGPIRRHGRVRPRQQRDILSYFEAARAGYYARSPGAPFMTGEHGSAHTFVLAEAQIAYRSPVLFGEPLVCRLPIRMGRQVTRSAWSTAIRAEQSPVGEGARRCRRLDRASHVRSGAQPHRRVPADLIEMFESSRASRSPTLI